jgi:hypothetical protein
MVFLPPDARGAASPGQLYIDATATIGAAITCSGGAACSGTVELQRMFDATWE